MFFFKLLAGIPGIFISKPEPSWDTHQKIVNYTEQIGFLGIVSCIFFAIIAFVFRTAFLVLNLLDITQWHYSWWYIIGPAIGSVVIAIISLITIIMTEVSY